MPTDAQRRNLASAHHAEVRALNERIALLEQQLSEAKRQMEIQKDEWLAWESKRSVLESDASMFRFMLDNDCDFLIHSDCRGAYLPQGEPLKDYLRAAITSTQEQTCGPSAK